MQRLDFTSFYRSTVGFDRVFNRLDALSSTDAKTYPPYNIESTGDNSYRITIAVAGFSSSDISIESKENSLTVKGGKETPESTAKRQFLHRGIAERAFELRFQLAEYVEVSGASMENGLLNIDLKREIPESKRARQIEITSSAPQSIEDKTVN